MIGFGKVAKTLNKACRKYLIIGGIASIFYGVPRQTIDMDIMVEAEKKW